MAQELAFGARAAHARPPRHATAAAAVAVFVQLALRWGRNWAAQCHLARAVGKRFRGCRAKRLYLNLEGEDKGRAVLPFPARGCPQVERAGELGLRTRRRARRTTDVPDIAAAPVGDEPRCAKSIDGDARAEVPASGWCRWSVAIHPFSTKNGHGVHSRGPATSEVALAVAVAWSALRARTAAVFVVPCGPCLASSRWPSAVGPRGRGETSPRSTGFCAIWGCISSSSHVGAAPEKAGAQGGYPRGVSLKDEPYAKQYKNAVIRNNTNLRCV